jgi:uncharacterized protein (TIGR03067 family)
MRRVLPLLIVLCLGFAPAPLPKQRGADEARRDLLAMQGEWTERFADSACVTISGDRMVWTSDHGWKFTLNAKATPKRIEAVGIGPRLAGKSRWGVYHLEKDKLTICWYRGSPGKMDWPADLDPIQKDVWVEVFTRVEP